MGDTVLATTGWQSCLWPHQPSSRSTQRCAASAWPCWGFVVASAKGLSLKQPPCLCAFRNDYHWWCHTSRAGAMSGHVCADELSRSAEKYPFLAYLDKRLAFRPRCQKLLTIGQPLHVEMGQVTWQLLLQGLSGTNKTGLAARCHQNSVACVR